MWYERINNHYRTTQVRSLYDVVVPSGFNFNISSPEWAHWFLDPHDTRFLEAACFHDYVILELGWSRIKSARLWCKILRERSDAPVFKIIVTTIVLAAWGIFK